MLSGYNKIFSASPVARHFGVFRRRWNKSTADVGMKVGPPMEYYLRRIWIKRDPEILDFVWLSLNSFVNIMSGSLNIEPNNPRYSSAIDARNKLITAHIKNGEKRWRLKSKVGKNSEQSNIWSSVYKKLFLAKSSVNSWWTYITKNISQRKSRRALDWNLAT